MLLGTCAALAVQSGVAVAAGQLVSLLPARAVHLGAGVLFLVSAILMWRGKAEDEQAERGGDLDRGFWRSAWLVFGVVFVAEWGDLTQLATAALAARYAAPLAVFAGATAALWSVAGIAVFVGQHAGKLLDPRVTRKVAAALFAAIGVALVTGVL